MKKIFYFLTLSLLLLNPHLLEARNVGDLRTIAQAGGSIEIDLAKKTYSLGELINLATSLNHGASLTLHLAKNTNLTAQQCAQIARAKPGKVKFIFD